MQFIFFKFALDDFKSLIYFNMLNNVIINHVIKIKALKIDVLKWWLRGYISK